MQKRGRIRGGGWIAVVASVLVAAAAGTARADYCHSIGFNGCPTGATQFCTASQILPTDPAAAQAACTACYGTPCQLGFLGCGETGYKSPAAADCSAPSFRFSTSCNGSPGTVQGVCAEVYYGSWSDAPHCFDGVWQHGLESRTDCGGGCSVACCNSDGVVDAGREDCDDGNLVDGDGCSSCRVDECYACSGAPSSCSVQAGASCTDDGNVCTVESCSASGVCQHPAGNEGGACGDDGNGCTLDQCAGGSCSHPGNTGAACADDGNPCTLDTCEASGACVHPGNTGASCADDGNPCTLDTCDAAGACVHPGNVGAPCDDDFNGCTVDVCDASGACTHPGNVGAACGDDGNDCTLDTCDAAGACSHPAHTGASCSDDGNPCTNDQCSAAGTCDHPPVSDGTSCDDSSACTQADTCQSGVCTGAEPVVCCNGGICNADSGACSRCPAGYESYSTWGCRKTFTIEDADLDLVESYCNTAEPISSNSMGFHWTDPGDPSVGDVLDFSITLGTSPVSWVPSGEVIPLALNGHTVGSYFLPQYLSCGGDRSSRFFGNSNSAYYTKNAVNTVLASWSGSPHGFRADDNGIFATVTVLYAALPTTPLADGTACNDGNACTPTDTCQSGACYGTGEVSCTASDDCHEAGTCDPLTGQCSNPPVADSSPCDDGNLCTQGDFCQNGICEGAAIDCSAGSQCEFAAGICNSSTGQCEYPPRPDGSFCNDGNACTQTDSCQAGVCTGGNPVVCGGAPDQCHSAGVCETDSGACEYPALPDYSLCNDGSQCTTIDACVGGVCTSLLNAPEGSFCTDGNVCTEDACHSGTCTSGPPKTCKTSDACHVAGVCDPINDCSETPISCDDGSACTTDSCNPATGCSSVPISCDDGSACTTDSCNPATGCSQVPITCDDGFACTTDSCDPLAGCVAEPTILSGCSAATGSKFGYTNSSLDDKDKLKWKWGPGASTSQAELGDPTDDADYRLCVFVSMGGVTTPFLEAEVPASSTAWSLLGSSGYKFGDKEGLSGGITKMSLKGSDKDKTKLGVSGKGSQLGDPMLPLGPSLTAMQVQLTNLGSGLCWESNFDSASIRSDDKKVSAAAP